MAHANVFTKLTKSNAGAAASTQTQEIQMDSKLIETVKLLGKQIIEVREIIDQQNQVIEELQSEVISLRKQQSETAGNINMTIIDQKDLAKQFRILKATVTGEQIANSKMYPNNSDEVAKRFYKNYDSSSLFESSIESPKANSTTSSWGSFNQNAPSQPRAIRAAVASSQVERSMQAENVAKEFIFGRIPKLLNLE